MTLAEFMLARIAEDEALARSAFEDGIRFVDGQRQSVPDDGRWRLGDLTSAINGVAMSIYDEGGHTIEQAQHIIRWDPARVLAECDAKRRIVGWIADSVAGVECWDILSFLALPYAAHPNYLEEWTP